MKKFVLSLILIALTFSFLTAKNKKVRTDNLKFVTRGTAITEKGDNSTGPQVHPIFFESFESGFPPAGWLSVSNGTAPQEWTVTSNISHSGNWSAVVPYGPAGQTMDEWLVTPAIDLSASPSAKLLFYEDQDYWDGYGDHHYVKISTTSQNNQLSFQTLIDMTPANHTINGFGGAPVEIDLSAYVGESTIYIAFQYTGTDADNWYLDDIGVYEPDEHDVRLVNFNLESHQTQADTYVPTAIVQNVGLNPESFSVSFGYYDWNENPVTIETKTIDDLAVGATEQVTYDDNTFGNDIQYNFFAYVNLTTDMDITNDRFESVINTFTNKKSMVMVEKGTGTWCGYCPGSARAIDHLYHNYPDSVTALVYHNDDDFENTMALARISFYGITGYPTAIFNGTVWSVGGVTTYADWSGVYNNYEAIYKALLSEKTGFSLSLDFFTTATKITVMATTTYIPFSAQQN